jgi:DNA (cytosine-5)-methyltransferase 1
MLAHSLNDEDPSTCAACDEDRTFLLRKDRPAYEGFPEPIRLVDLFCGCGGLSLGIAEAASRLGRGTKVCLAIDHDEDAVNVFKANFPAANVRLESVESLFNGQLGARTTNVEKELADDIGSVDILVGGPPCQGYSDLNNHTRRADPRNALYARMARAARRLNPRIVLIENVPTIRHDVAALDATLCWLRKAGYLVGDAVLDLSHLGAPQRRRRHVVLALRNDIDLDPENVLTTLAPRCDGHTRDVRWAIENLEDMESATLLDAPSVSTLRNKERIRWLFEQGKYDLDNSQRPMCHQSQHSYRSMYGRLRWDQPAQTVTTGFGSMGQGRYVHPSKRRTITPHEAARLQMLPDFFDFSAARTRGSVARMIGNSVPPILGMTIGGVVLEAVLRDSDIPRETAVR